MAPSSRLRRASRSSGRSTTRGSHSEMSAAPASASRSPSGFRPLHIERLGRVRERVQRRADGHIIRQAERELRLVDDPGQVPAGAATRISRSGSRIAEARRPTRRPSRWSERRRRESGLDRDRLREVDRASAADREQPVGSFVRGLHASAMRSEGTSDQRPATSTGGSQRGLATRNGRSMPASARSRGSSSRPQRTITRGLRRTRRRRRPPAVDTRPVARTSEISRDGSRPWTPAATSVLRRAPARRPSAR